MAKQAKAALALLTAPTSEGKKDSKKASAKKSPEKEKASQRTKEIAALANASALELCKEYQVVYNKASFAKETAKNKRKAAATKIFQFYANLLSLDAKYSWLGCAFLFAFLFFGFPVPGILSKFPQKKGILSMFLFFQG